MYHVVACLLADWLSHMAVCHRRTDLFVLVGWPVVGYVYWLVDWLVGVFLDSWSVNWLVSWLVV